MDDNSPSVERQYDPGAFDMPEGAVVDHDAFEAVMPTFVELNLTQDQAGKLVGAYAGKIVPMVEQRAQHSIDETAADLRAEMLRELEADPEVGGVHLNESRAYAAKAIAHFLPDPTEREPFTKFLNASGFGNQRHLVRILAGAGRRLTGRPLAEKAVTEADKFYGR